MLYAEHELSDHAESVLYVKEGTSSHTSYLSTGTCVLAKSAANKTMLMFGQNRQPTHVTPVPLLPSKSTDTACSRPG